MYRWMVASMSLLYPNACVAFAVSRAWSAMLLCIKHKIQVALQCYLLASSCIIVNLTFAC